MTLLDIRRGKDGRVKPCLTAWQRAAVHGVAASEQQKNRSYICIHEIQYCNKDQNMLLPYRLSKSNIFAVSAHQYQGNIFSFLSESVPVFKFVPNFIIFLGEDTEMAYHRRQANLNSVVDPHWF
jgi:hypothetical protein